MNSFRLWMHGIAAAAVGGAVTALAAVMVQPADVHFDAASLHRYASAAGGGAIIAVLAYFRQSPLQPVSSPPPESGSSLACPGREACRAPSDGPPETR